MMMLIVLVMLLLMMFFYLFGYQGFCIMFCVHQEGSYKRNTRFSYIKNFLAHKLPNAQLHVPCSSEASVKRQYTIPYYWTL